MDPWRLSRRWPRWALPAVMLGLIALGCATAPITGRSQLMLVSPEEEAQLGLTAFQQVLEESELSTNTRYRQMVEEVGRRIVAQIEPDAVAVPLEWRFEVIADSQVNAFALPGGKVAFYEGILPICQDANGVAVVMGHEIAHVMARHGGERVSIAMAQQGGLQFADVLSAMIAGEEYSQERQLGMAALAVGSQVGSLAFSREHESEADRIGLIYMARAGYDPREAVRFWQRMEEASGSRGGLEWLSTHPSHGTRIEDLKGWMPDALEIYRKVKER